MEFRTWFDKVIHAETFEERIGLILGEEVGETDFFLILDLKVCKSEF